ncbi:hypothetical protein Ancab_007353 [Ancistrocladus abbreviatus]
MSFTQAMESEHSEPQIVEKSNRGRPYKGDVLLQKEELLNPAVEKCKDNKNPQMLKTTNGSDVVPPELEKELTCSKTTQLHTPWVELMETELSKKKECNREVLSTGVANMMSLRLSLIANAPHSILEVCDSSALLRCVGREE